jgi:endonuclease/exonuclease/phosphatase family metal-dependent hydrolase
MSRFKSLLVATSLFGVAGTAASGEIDVMTQNQYLGADIAPLIGAIGDPAQFNLEVIEALEQIAANRSQQRFGALAAEITQRRPHLVGLQEVWQFNCIPAVPELGGYPCNAPDIAGAFSDHLTGTVNALGGGYEVAAVVQNFSVQSYTLPGPTVVPGIPFFYEGVPAFLQVMDRDVILARADVDTTVVRPGVDYTCSKVSVDGCNYDVDLPLGPLGSVKRGFVGVDATVNGDQYRFFNTHLEVEAGGPIPPEVQTAQALQLLTVVLGTTPQDVGLIVVGDMNSAPDDPAVNQVLTPYMLFALAQMNDTWLQRPGGLPGLSCCQPEDLRNQQSLLTRRIDLIYSRELPAQVKDARVLGAVTSFKTSPAGLGLWPSDHATVAARLQY